ncbi:iron complex transport system substrate-binding protein [Desulfofundulus australicus DSM 11792]|uniref:Iron complex transport system substrate-binding protein n=1 Tax=Desulfofundulus australicus DSM 11792 TaxID=1121425 RepID=A0A1M5A8H4_9FIRM|nr:iron complex transport system substrate-binding protein [Desulfofundulus australicus DSM 11792]
MAMYPKYGRILSILSLICLIILLAGCTVEKVRPGEKVSLQYATGFSIENLPAGCKKVTDGDGRELLLVPRGKKPPAGYGNLPVFYTPVQKVVVGSTTQAALLRPLGVLGTIGGVTTEKKDWYIDEVTKGMEKGRVAFLGKNSAPDYEKIKALSPDVVFTYTHVMGGTEFAQKLNELGIPYAVDNEWLESHPLGRVEWVKFLAAFYNKEKEADDYFRQVVANVEQVARKVPAGTRPKVLWGSIFKGKVYVPAGNSYVARMIEMAGGDYVFKDLGGSATGNANITLEEFYARGKDADIFIIPFSPQSTGITSIAKLLEQAPVLADIKPVKEKRIWCVQPWYYQSMDKTDEQIEDLAAMFYPVSWSGYQPRHFMSLPEK